MTRIKSGNVHLGGSFVVPIEQSSHNKKVEAALEREQEIILNAEKKATEIIVQAQSQAQNLIDEAVVQATSQTEEIIKKAYDEGFASGHQAGFEQVTQELQDKIVTVDNFAKSDFEIKNLIIKSAHLDIINLVVEIAQKVCTKSLELDKKILTEITQSAIQSLKDKETITIIVNPEMAEKIYSISDELKEKIPQLTSIKIIEDTSVSPDGTIVESPLSRVDSRIKSQIGEISERLMAKLNSSNAAELAGEVNGELDAKTQRGKDA